MEQAGRPCPGCTERDRHIDELKRRVAELERRLDEQQRAAKRQAAPFAKGPPKARPKKPGRKPGPAHGPHAHRPPPPPDAIQETLEAPLPDACPHCGGAVHEDEPPQEQFQIDLPARPVHRRIRIHRGGCTRCGRRVRGRHPLQTSGATGAAASQIGPHAQAAIVYLNKRAGMSYGKIADYFRQVSGITLRPSTATRIVLRAADRLGPAYEAIRQSVRGSQVITPDETGWRLGGRPVWLHAWVGDAATCYVIDPHRGADALEELIGRSYPGTLVHDGFAAYDRFDAAHQQCVAHPLRRAHALEQAQAGRAKAFPRQVIELFHEALARRDALARSGGTEAAREAAYERFFGRMDGLTARPRANAVNARFARHLRAHLGEWFFFLLEPGVPATNFRAEQALRVPIVNRKVFGGNRTEAGARAQVVTASVIQTCRQQGQSALGALRDAVCGLVGRVVAAITGAPASAHESPRIALS
jgi:transposase